MAKSHLKLVTPTTVKRTVTPRRRPNAELRTREHLTEAEVERLLKAAGKNRWGHRDSTMLLVAYRHGLRASELVDLRWDQVDFRTANLHVRRVKQGTPSTHPILGDELRALRRLAAGAGAQEPVRVHLRAGSAIQYRRVRPHGRAGRGGGQAQLQGSPAHAQARLWVRAGQQGARHAGVTGLPWPQEHSAHRAVHRAVADAVQGFLALIVIFAEADRSVQ